jgi:superfamily II DNA/RNA helicase
MIREMKKQQPNISDMDALIQSSSKLVLVDKLLSKFRSETQKVLIFSQSLDMLDVLEDYLDYRKYQYVRLDGGTNIEGRIENIDNFNNDVDCFVFLLSTKAGGIGINLTAANNVIIYDSDFNPFNDSQAAARCHRIGQTRPVSIFRLITRNSYEKFILERAGIKLTLGSLIVDKDAKFKNSPEELKLLLKKGAYHFFLEDEKTAQEKDKELLNTDIEDLIKKGTVIEYASQGQIEKENIESVYFSAMDGEENINLNDDEFWEKLIPEGMNDPETLTKQFQNAHLELTTKEKKETFFGKLKDVVKGLERQSMSHRDGIEYKQNLWTLVYKITHSDDIFTPEQIKLAEKYLEFVDGKSNRKKIDFLPLNSSSQKISDDEMDDNFIHSSGSEDSEDFVEENETNPTEKKLKNSSSNVSFLKPLKKHEIKPRVAPSAPPTFSFKSIMNNNSVSNSTPQPEKTVTSIHTFKRVTKIRPLTDPHLEFYAKYNEFVKQMKTLQLQNREENVLKLAPMENVTPRVISLVDKKVVSPNVELPKIDQFSVQSNPNQFIALSSASTNLNGFIDPYFTGKSVIPSSSSAPSSSVVVKEIQPEKSDQSEIDKKQQEIIEKLKMRKLNKK